MKSIEFKRYKVDSEQATQYIFRLFNVTCWVSTHHKEYGFFRFFGRGLNWVNKKRGLSFSEKIGKSKYWIFGKWKIRYLPCRK